MWNPSTPACIVKTNSLSSTKGNGHVIAGLFARPMNLFNHEVVLDSLVSIISLRIHFSHLGNPSTLSSLSSGGDPSHRCAAPHCIL
uniref:Uncharacterized protein n=1 Tax=Arundo donax TaxID=35708 RepID=A0A0A9DKF3_ARUDO